MDRILTHMSKTTLFKARLVSKSWAEASLDHIPVMSYHINASARSRAEIPCATEFLLRRGTRSRKRRPFSVPLMLSLFESSFIITRRELWPLLNEEGPEAESVMAAYYAQRNQALSPQAVTFLAVGAPFIQDLWIEIRLVEQEDPGLLEQVLGNLGCLRRLAIDIHGWREEAVLGFHAPEIWPLRNLRTLGIGFTHVRF